MSSSDAPSASQVEKAGSRLRKCLRGDRPFEEIDQHIDTIERHRRAHAQPMLTANVAMRRFTERLGVSARVTQRLKRMSTIIEKLTARESQMNLAKMRDIGGVRVVVSTLEDLRKLQRHVENRRKSEGVKTIDYVDHPRQSGYRAVHLICMYGGDPKPVEIQLRTSTMHAWAEMVEQVSNIVGVNRKQDGDTAFHRWARLYSGILEAQELGKSSPVTDDEFNAAWRTMLEEGRSHD